MGKLTDVVEENDIEEVKKLLDRFWILGGYKNSSAINEETNNDGWLALHIGASRGYLEIIELLIKSGAKVDQPTKEAKPVGELIQSNERDTPLHIASSCGQVDAIQILLKSGAKVDQPNKNGETPLYAAARRGNTEAIGVLLKGGAKVDQRNYNGWRPIFAAALYGHGESIKKLLEGGAKVNHPDDGITPLHKAIDGGRVSAIQVLLESGANVNHRSRDGSTYLHEAVNSGELEIIEVLLSFGADISLKSKGKTPLDIAKEKGYTEIAQLLEKHIPQQQKNASLPTSSTSLTQEFGVLKISFSIPYEELSPDKELGRGGFGIVYQGTWRKHTNVAIKQLQLTQFSKEALERFQKEIETMAQLRSPNIVQLYGACFKSPYCIVMEFMAKGSLFQVLHGKEPLAWSQREQVALDMAKGLSFLHHENVIHRDLKSLNVLLDNQLNAKLSDFGLATIKTETNSLSPSTIDGQVVGTLTWMAPELFKRRSQCTTQSDVYSLGMTLWELASRDLPFKDATSKDLIPKWVSEGEREEIPKNTPPKIAKMITWCWDGEAAKRPTADQVVEGLKLEDSNDNSQFLNSGPRYVSNFSQV